MTIMSRSMYAVAAALAGEHLTEVFPEPFRIAGRDPHALPLVSRAVYVAVDATNAVRYVGSVSRTRATGFSDRTREHVRDWFKERDWVAVYVIPLAPNTPGVIVRSIEGRIGRRLCPCDNSRLPRL
jgi:hypothetical protein